MADAKVEGEWTAVGGYEKVIIIDGDGNEWSPPVSKVSCFDWAPDSNTLCVCTDDNEVFFFDAKEKAHTSWSNQVKGKVPEEVRQEKGSAFGVAFEGNGKVWLVSLGAFLFVFVCSTLDCKTQRFPRFSMRERSS